MRPDAWIGTAADPMWRLKWAVSDFQRANQEARRRVRYSRFIRSRGGALPVGSLVEVRREAIRLVRIST